MSGLFIFLAIFAVIAVIDVLAQTHGVDSRPEYEDRRAPIAGIYS